MDERVGEWAYMGFLKYAEGEEEAGEDDDDLEFNVNSRAWFCIGLKSLVVDDLAGNGLAPLVVVGFLRSRVNGWGSYVLVGGGFGVSSTAEVFVSFVPPLFG